MPTVYDRELQGDDTLGVLRILRRVATEEENGGDRVPPNSQNQGQEEDVMDVIDLDEAGYVDPLSPIPVREQRVAKARRALGFNAQVDREDQADQAAVQDHRTIDVATLMQLLHSQDDGVSREALHIFHVEGYNADTERVEGGWHPSQRLQSCPSSGASLSGLQALGASDAAQQPHALVVVSGRCGGPIRFVVLSFCASARSPWRRRRSNLSLDRLLH